MDQIAEAQCCDPVCNPSAGSRDVCGAQEYDGEAYPLELARVGLRHRLPQQLRGWSEAPDGECRV
jgi:hypothetical protein